MAGWLRIALRSFATAAGAGAAALGAAQALAILVWSTVPTPEVWRRQLTWLVFIYASAVLVGVAGGRRSVRTVRQAIANRRLEAAAAWNSGAAQQTGARPGQRALATARHRAIDLGRRIAMAATRGCAAGFAALGAYTSFLLVWLPARNALPAADIGTLALAAAIGTAIGAVAAVWALIAAPIAANVAIWIGAMWIFGLASAGLAIATGEPTSAPRLGVLDAPHLIGPDEWWLGPNVMVLFAALFAFAVAATARWVGANRITIAVCGVAGPSLVAATYVVVGSDDGLRSAFIAALVAPAAGLLASVATALVRRRSSAKTASAAAGATATAATTSPAGSPSAATTPATTPASVTTASAAPAPATVAAATATPTPAPAAGAYPAPNPAWQYPAAAQYSANPYPTNQYPTAPVGATPSSVDTQAPVATPATTPAPAPVATAAATAEPAAASAERASTRRTKSSRTQASHTTASRTTTSRAKTARSGAETTRSGAEKAAEVTPLATAGGAGTGGDPTASEPADRPRGRGPEKKESSRSRRTQQPVRPEPVRPDPTAEPDLPRTARPAEVVAVQATRPAPEAEPGSLAGRRARRRAAKLAAARAQEEERLRKQIELEEKSMGKREREHVDWVKHLTSIPVDPTLLGRKK